MRGLGRLARLSRRIRRSFAPAAVILLYHRVAEVAADPEQVTVSPARFADHLEVIRQTCYPMRLLDLVTAVHRRAIPRRAVVLTFDDGFADFVQEAYPLLWAADIPATVFVISGEVAPSQQAAEAAAAPQQLPRIMHADELRLLTRDGLVEVGSHSVTHPVLASLSRDQQRVEIRGSRAQLEGLLGSPVVTFAYPYGRRHDYTEETAQLVREAGYEAACAATPGSVELGADPLALPRYWINDWDRETFAHHLERTFRW
jgi:peptidoglycan/xylan/chitin deacetylase (PgdA/CDA1 family)